jgi:predicted acyltransferase
MLSIDVFRGIAIIGMILVNNPGSWTDNYWLLMKLVPVPGYGAGVLTPEGNLAAYIDHLLLPGHTYQPTWDPEGLLTTIPAVATTLLGVLAGDWLRATRDAREKLLGLVAAGAAGVVLGMIMSIWFPINKSLWTSSYVVFTGGAALLVLALCYDVIDLRRHRGWITPFVIFGSNPITVYVLSTMVGQMMEDFHISQAGSTAITLRSYLLDSLFAPWAGKSGGSLLFAIAYVLAWLPPMAALYRRRIFIKI